MASKEIEKAHAELMQSMDRLSNTIDRLRKDGQMTEDRKKVALDGLGEVRRMLERTENAFFEKARK